MKKIIHSCDFFGYSPSLYIEGQIRYKSIFTGILSICVSLLGILCTGYFGSELFLNSSPVVVQSRDVNDDFGPVQFSNKEFVFLFAMEYDNNTLYSDPSVFPVEAYTMITYTKAVDVGQTIQEVVKLNLTTGLCSEFYNETDIVEKNMILPLNMYYCIEPGSASMSGFWGSKSPFSKTKIIFNRCANSTQNNFTCRPPEEIDQIIQSGYISIKYTAHNMDQNNYTSPLTRILYNDFNILNAGSSMEYAIQISPLVFNSDSGLVFPSQTEYNGFSSTSRIFIKNEKSANIFTASFEGNSIGAKYFRSYIKLQTVLTQIGGFIKAIMLVASGISMIVSQDFYFSFFLMKLISGDENKNNDGAPIKGDFNKSENDLIKKIDLNLIKFKNNNRGEEDLDIKEENKSNKIKNDNMKINITNNQLVYYNKDLNTNFKNTKIFDYIKSNTYKDFHNQICLKYKNKNTTSSMINYLSNKILIFKNHSNKSLNFKLIYSLKIIFKKVLSIDTILTKTFEIEYLKKLYERKLRKNISVSDITNENNFLSIDKHLLDTLAFTLENKKDLNKNVFMFED